MNEKKPLYELVDGIGCPLAAMLAVATILTLAILGLKSLNLF